MNKEDIIRMALEAEVLSKYESATGFCAEAAAKFAYLVAQLERERIAKKLEQLPFGDTASSFAIYVRES